MPQFELPIEKNKHAKFEWRGEGGLDSFVICVVSLFEYNVSTILSPIAVLSSVL